MNYRTQINDRSRRRRARLITALITTGMLASFAYFSGLLDDLPSFLNDKPTTVQVDGPVANV